MQFIEFPFSVITTLYVNTSKSQKNVLLEPLFWLVCSLRLHVAASVAEWLTPWTPHLEVRGSSLAHHIVSLGTELYSTLPLFAQVYKWVSATYCWGVTLQWTSISSGGSSITCRGFMLRPSSFFSPFSIVRLTQIFGIFKKEKKINDIVKPFITGNNSFNLKMSIVTA